MQSDDKDVVPKERDLKLTSNAKLLIEEGYKRLDVQRALKLSHGKLDLGRRLLLLAKDEHGKLMYIYICTHNNIIQYIIYKRKISFPSICTIPDLS